MTGVAKELFEKPNTLFQDQLNETSVQSMIKKIQEQDVSAGVFLHQPVDDLFQALKRQIKVIEAGGGLVHTDENTILMIFRKGKWDLPKGKRDEGETIAETGLREVQEETGLSALQLEKPLAITYHTYYQKDELILKESHWFLMKITAQQTLIPQLEEDIEKCEWVNIGALADYLKNTHPSIIDVVNKGIEKLHTAKTF